MASTANHSLYNKTITQKGEIIMTVQELFDSGIAKEETKSVTSKNNCDIRG